MDSNNNPSFSHTIKSIKSYGSKQFFKEKFLPKVKLIKEYFKDGWNDLFILDIGIGYGSFLNLLEDNFFKNLFGMEPYPDSIKLSKTLTSADVRLGKIEDESWPFNKHSFDVITCFDVIEHLEFPEEFFIKVRNYLKKDGIIIVTTPNKGLPYKMRSLPVIGIPDKNSTHINLQKPKYWINLVKVMDYNIQYKWKGEHLTHIKTIPNIFKQLCKIMKLDHRKVPFINSFEQSFCMLLKLNYSDQS